MPDQDSLPTTRRTFRRTDDFTPGTPKVQLISDETIKYPLDPYSVLIKVHAIALNYRDANIANGGNPWPVTPHGIPCNDACGTIISIGSNVTTLKIGDRVAPIIDTENLTGQETKRSWLAADEDGVLADYLVFDEKKVSKLPSYLDDVQASIIPCAGTTAWAALKGLEVGKSVLIQGTGGVSMFALKLAKVMGLKIILTSSSDEKLEEVRRKFGSGIETINYRTNAEWHEEVMKLTNGVGVDCVVEVGGATSLIKSMKCTRRGGIVSVVGYLSGKQEVPGFAEEFLSVVIDRRVNVRGINADSKQGLDDLCAALEANQLYFDDIIDSVMPFEKAEEAIERVWQGKVVGKLVLKV